MKLLTIVGTRPNFIKLSPLDRELRKDHTCITVHTGQHFDDSMYESFFREFGKYAMMLAADDVLINQDYIADAIGILERTDAKWCYASIMVVGPHIQKAKPVFTKWLLHPLLDNLVLQFPSICEILLHKRNPVNASTLMFDMEMYHDYNLSWVRDGDRGVCDGIILKQLFENGIPGKAIGDVGAFYRIHDGQVSNTDEFKKAQENFKNG